MTQLLTNSRAATFRTCPRKHFLRYELGLAPEEESQALRIGRAFHTLQELVDIGESPDAVMATLEDVDEYDKAVVAAMFITHQERWQHEPTHEVVASELAFELPLVNPATGAPSRLWRRAGVIDRIYRIGDRLYLKDYKTTTEDMSPGSDYWTRLALDQQMSIYVAAARELGYDVVGVFYDVVARPMHRPAKATPPDKIKYKKDGEPYAGTRTVDETPDEFFVRVADAMRADLDRFFVRHEVARTDRDLEEVQAEQWMQQLAIREAQRSGYWFRNPGACVSPYRCPYLSICGHDLQASDLTIPAGFQRLESVHPELARVEQATHASSEQAEQPNGV